MARSSSAPLALMLVAVVVLVAGCSQGAIEVGPTGSGTPAASPSAGAATASLLPPPPTPSSVGSATSQTPRPSFDPTLALGRDVIAEVVTTDLVMRTAPAISPESIIYRGRLGPGDRLYLVDGPVPGDGYDWYLASPYLARVNDDIDATSTVWVAFGWVAAADRTGEPWIMPVEPQCPSTATVEILHDLDPVLRLACFGGSAVTLEGDVTCPDMEPPIPVSQPDWLTWDACHINPSGAQPSDPRQGRTNLGVAIHYPPGVERLSGPLRIIGHFDDPSAQACVLLRPFEESDVYGPELSRRASQFSCRASLVVDEARTP